MDADYNISSKHKRYVKVNKEENVHKIDLIIELIRRMDYLIIYEIIDNSWEKPLRELETKILKLSGCLYEVCTWCN